MDLMYSDQMKRPSNAMKEAEWCGKLSETLDLDNFKDYIKSL